MMIFINVLSFLLIITGILLGTFRLIEYIEKRAKNNWKPVISGYFYELADKRISDASFFGGGYGYYIKIPAATFATLILLDSEGNKIWTKVMNLDSRLLPPQGTYITLYKNDRAGFRIEVKEKPAS